jgi:hypothetical protein
MSGNSIKVILMVISWMFCGVAGVLFIRRGIEENEKPSKSKLKAIWKEIKFRLNLVAGILLLGWVIYGFVWLIINWR